MISFQKNHFKRNFDPGDWNRRSNGFLGNRNRSEKNTTLSKMCQPTQCWMILTARLTFPGTWRTLECVSTRAWITTFTWWRRWRRPTSSMRWGTELQMEQRLAIIPPCLARSVLFKRDKYLYMLVVTSVFNRSYWICPRETPPRPPLRFCLILPGTTTAPLTTWPRAWTPRRSRRRCTACTVISTP